MSANTTTRVPEWSRRRTGEQVGAESLENAGEPPRTVIPGIGGVGGGNRSFDLLAVDEKMESIDFVEAKGGLHPKMGHARNLLPDGRKGEVLEQGTAAYLNHIARRRALPPTAARQPRLVGADQERAGHPQQRGVQDPHRRPVPDRAHHRTVHPGGAHHRRARH